MKQSIILATLSALAVANAGPLDTLVNACKIQCLPAFSAVSGCVHDIKDVYTATFVPANMSVALSGDGEKLKACGCGADVHDFVSRCIDCVNGQGCTPTPIDYGRLCTDGDYPGEMLSSFHGNLQCGASVGKRIRRRTM